ncbi:MAG: hypothetical protein KJN92_03720, partial [Gemmatimonadetes bacterium]|nr:hypothetical protein [Gemmatimonadota bacterium]
MRPASQGFLWMSYLVFALALLGNPDPALSQTAEETAGPRPIGLQDALDWKRIVSPSLSSDGAWFAYRLSPGEGNSELVVRSTDDETEHRFPVGEGGGSVQFSDDSRWLAFAIAPDQEESDRPRGQGPPARNKVGILELASGEISEVEDVQSFAFAGERGGWIALRKYGAQGGGGGGSAGPSGPPGQRGGGGNDSDDRARGVDIVLHELATGARLNIGNVSEFEFDESGQWLSWVVDAQGMLGNGIQLRDMESGVITVLESDEARYSDLAWDDDGRALIVLKAVEDDEYEDPLHSIIGWTAFDGRNGPTKVVFDPEGAEGFPEGMTVSPNRPPRWSEALDAFHFGIHELEMKEGAGDDDEAAAEEEGEEEAEEEEGPSRPDSDELSDDEKPDLVLWHWKDPRLQRAQELQASRDRDFSYASVYWVGPKRFVRLADDEVKNVIPARTGSWAIGRDNRAYELMAALDGRQHQDIYAVNMRNGGREMILE